MLGFWSSGVLECKSGLLEWSSGDLDFWSSGWKSADLEVWSSGNLEIQHFEVLQLRKPVVLKFLSSPVVEF